jgi:hypothetical protein
MLLNEQRFTRAWLLLSNATMMIGWAKVLKALYHNWASLMDVSQPSVACLQVLDMEARIAVLIGFLEFFNAMTQMTKSSPVQVLLFCMVRASVELLVAPLMLPICNNWQHVATLVCWSLGDTIRFWCFTLDVLVPGGMIMVVSLAYQKDWKILYLVAALWPVGFYPLMKSLLRNRRRFFSPSEDTSKAKIKTV